MAPCGVLVVVGGAGFLGRRIVSMALDNWSEVRCVDLVPFPVSDANASRVRSIVVDLTKTDGLDSYFNGADVVIHAAAVVDVRPRLNPALVAVNVEGTRRVVVACKSAGVRRLVLTSTMDVVYDGTPKRDADESCPYPTRPANHYIRSKIDAERLVLTAHGPELTTCVLRPTGIYGPHDRHRLGVLVPLVRSGKLAARFGNGRATFDHVFVDNVAHAHLLAADALLRPEAKLGGQCYFVGDHGYEDFFGFLAPFFHAIGAPLPTTSLPRWLALAMAGIAQLGYAALGRVVPRLNPELSRYTVDALTQDFYFSWRKAARDFGYAPLVSRQDAFDRTVEWARAEGL